MLTQVFGSCFEIKEQLKKLGCQWDANAKCWLAPAETYSEAQSLADVENRREWMEFMGTLPWCKGSLTATAWDAALRAASLRIDYAEAWREIASRVRSEKPVNDGWFDRNIGRAYAKVVNAPAVTALEGGAGRQAKEKPTFKNEVLSAVALRAAGVLVGIRYLAERSPVDPMSCKPHDFLEALYEPGERVVVFDKFSSQGQWVWDYNEGFLPTVIASGSVYEKTQPPFERAGKEFAAAGADGVWYLCNPVTGDWRWMDDVAGGDEPHWSRRFQDCVTSWRYMVLESDKARAREWVAMAVQLPLRIAAIYTSGGKSVHVLVRVDARTKGEWDAWRDQIKPIVVTLGADAGCMSAVRLTRLPCCMRGGNHQRLLYLNPSPDMQPIEARKRVREVAGKEGK